MFLFNKNITLYICIYRETDHFWYKLEMNVKKIIAHLKVHITKLLNAQKNGCFLCLILTVNLRYENTISIFNKYIEQNKYKNTRLDKI